MPDPQFPDATLTPGRIFAFNEPDRLLGRRALQIVERISDTGGTKADE